MQDILLSKSLILNKTCNENADMKWMCGMITSQAFLLN